VASPAAEPAAETAPGGPQQLPTPNPAAAPAPGFQIFANANTVNDVALDGASLWAATTGGALRWETASATATTFSADGMGPGPLSAVVVCNMEGFGAVFGGSSGLQIFDSVTGGWSQVTAGSGALAFNDVASLACDAEQGILAVGYRSEGVDIYRRRLDRWSYTAPADGLFTQGATAVAVGPGGVVWAASGGTLVQIQGTRTTTYTPDDSALNGEAITALRTDTDGALWVTAGNRLLRFKDGAWESYDRGAADFPRATLVDVAPIQSGRAWLLSADAEVCRFDPEFESCTPFYAPSAQAANGATVGMVSGPATALDADASGLVAYGTAGQGSSLQARGQWTALAQPAGFPASNRIFALASDARGFLWVATTAGVQQADPARPTEVAYRYTTATDGLLTTNVRTLFADARGGVWLGGIGASYFDGTRWINYTQADGLAGDEITAIAEDSQGRIWFGTRTGLSIWTGTTFFNLTGANGLPDSDILSLAADGPGMWIGSANGGLYRFESNQLQVLTEENVGLPSNRITALLVMDDGTTLVGTDAGLARFDGGIVSRVDGVPATRITALAAAPGGTAWVGAADGGLFVAAGGQSFAPYTTPAGDAPAATVRAITVDLYGSAWIGGDSGGLARIAP
jgi:ligand-binding sensor domain-containing protein